MLGTEGHEHHTFFLPVSWLARTDPADVARVERQTFISTTDQRETVPTPKHNSRCQLGNWMSTEDMDQELNMRFPNCMRGRLMCCFYVYDQCTHIHPCMHSGLKLNVIKLSHICINRHVKEKILIQVYVRRNAR